MEPNIQEKLDALERKIDAVYESSEKTRKYFMMTLIASVLLFVLPLIGLLFAIPSFINTYSSAGF